MAKNGCPEAFTDLWNLHFQRLVGTIRKFTGFDPEEIAQETFTRIYVQISKGDGPDGAFMPYAIRIARNIATDMSRRAEYVRTTSHCSETLNELAGLREDHSELVLETTLTHRAFSDLPENWRAVLWWRDVQGMSVKGVAARTKKSEEGAATLIRRAREGFKQSWIAAHLTQVERLESECAWTVSRLPKYHRSRLSMDDELRVATHLEACDRCDESSRTAGAVRAWLTSILVLAGLGVTSKWALRAPDGKGSSTSAAQKVLVLALVPLAVLLGHFILLAVERDTSLIQRPVTEKVMIDEGENEAQPEVKKPVVDVSATGVSGGAELDSNQTPPAAQVEPSQPLAVEQPPVSNPDPIPDPLPSPAPTPTPAPTPAFDITASLLGLSGTATPGSEILLKLIEEGVETAQYTAPVLPDGTWSFDLPAGLTGIFTVEALEMSGGVQVGLSRSVAWIIPSP